MTSATKPSDPSQHHLAHPKYRPDIDGLRAIAIISVVCFHAFPNWLGGGFVGVDVFFVISGFLISYIIFSSLENGVFSFSEFYARRIKRIFPALLLVLGACFAFGWIALLADEYKQLGKHIAAGAGFASNFFFWQEAGYFDNSAETKPLLHLWSLGIEEQFYIAWPLFLFWAHKRRFNLLSLALAIILISFSINVYKIQSDTVQAFYSPITRVWELLIGSALAYASLHKIKFLGGVKQQADAILSKIIYSNPPSQDGTAFRDTLSLLGFIMICVAAILVGKNDLFPGWWALLPVFGAYLIISAGPHAWFNREILSHRILVWFGLISYPLYLWHWPLLSYARIIESSTPSLKIRITAILASIILAWLTYRLIEKPIRFGKHGKITVALLCLSMIATGFVGYGTYKKDGLKDRKATAGFVDSFTFAFAEDCDQFGWKGGLCNFADGPDGASVILIGDSFSSSYSTFLAGIKKKSSFQFTQAGLGLCPLLLDFGPPECAAAANKVFELIKSHENLKFVFISSNFHWYATGQAGTKYGKTASADAFNASLINTVDAYRKIGRRVVLLLTPPYGKDPKACAPRPFKLASCDFPRPEDIEKSNRIIKALWGTDNPPDFFDAFPYLCDSNTCRLTNGGGDIYYIDSWHLSIKGGEYLAGAAIKDFARLLAD